MFCPVVESSLFESPDCSRNSAAAALKGGDKDAADRKGEKNQRNEIKQQSEAADH